MQTLDYECETALGTMSVAVHGGNSREITNIEYFARWKPAVPFPATRWERKSFVSDESWHVLDQLNADSAVWKSARRLLSSRYVMTNRTVKIPNPVLALAMEDEDAVLYSSTTLRTENIPLFGIVLSLRFGICEFLDVLAGLKPRV